MTTIRRIFATLGITATLYTIAAGLFGALGFAHWLITITAIDHWHPNWPDPTTVDATAKALPVFTGPLAFIMFLAYFGTYYLARFFPSGSSVTASRVPVAHGGAAMALAGSWPYRPTRERFHTDLCDMLRTAGATPDKALAAADAAMLLTNSDDPADWAGRIREEALTIAGFTGATLRITSRHPRLEESAHFFNDYGYRTTRLRRVGSNDDTDDHFLNFTGLIVFYRTSAHAAEEALIELLITAHQGHMASMADNGSPGKADAVEQNAKALKHVSMKLALRGFVPPELDAEIGRDGTATAEELERWAIAQVVAACSPMTRMPLPTIERTIGGQQ